MGFILYYNIIIDIRNFASNVSSSYRLNGAKRLVFMIWTVYKHTIYQHTDSIINFVEDLVPIQDKSEAI